MSIATVTARMRAHGKSKVLLDTFADAIDQAAAAEREALQQQKPYGWIVEWFPTDDVGDTLIAREFFHDADERDNFCAGLRQKRPVFTVTGLYTRAIAPL